MRFLRNVQHFPMRTQVLPLYVGILVDPTNDAHSGVNYHAYIVLRAALLFGTQKQMV